jgi:hypothetical protein
MLHLSSEILQKILQRRPSVGSCRIKETGKSWANEGSPEEYRRTVKDVKSIGPVSVATFMGITDKDEYDRMTRDAYELLQFIVRGVKNK